MMSAAPNPAAEIAALRAALVAAEARATSAEAEVEHLKLLIAKLRRERYGQSSERGHQLLDQLELQLEELETAAAEDAGQGETDDGDTTVRAFTHRKPKRAPLPADLPRERVVLPSPEACPCCGGGDLVKLGEDVTETLEVVPRQWKVVQTVREKFSCRACEAITQPPAPHHAIPRGRAGPGLLATILNDKFAMHLPLTRQSRAMAAEGIKIDVSTSADWVGAACVTLRPLHDTIRTHVLAAERLHGDDTTVPVLARKKTVTGRLWIYVRDDRPFGGADPPAALFFYSRDRSGAHAREHLAEWSGILQADAFAGKCQGPSPAPIQEAACWAHARRKLRAGRCRQGESALGHRSRPPDRPHLQSRARDQRRDRRGSPQTPARRSVPWSTTWRPGCRPSGPSWRAQTPSPAPWTTCSNGGRPLLGSLPMDASVSPTMPPNAR